MTSGAITTDISINNAVLDDATKKWVTDNVDAMKKAAMDLVKTEIFDWDPSKTDSKASTSRGWWSEVFGGSSVSLKSDHQRHSVNYSQTLVLNETISVSQTVGGDLNDLVPAVRANLDKYLAVIDIGEYFKKVQVAGFCAVDFTERVDGNILTMPLKAVQIEVGYPAFSASTEGGQPNLSMLAQGSHYVLGQTAPKGPTQPAIWTADNAKDFVNISFLRLDNPLPGWPADQVKVRRKLIFDIQDPRVNLSAAATPHDPAVVELEELTTDHSPSVSIGMVGSIFVRFAIGQTLLPPNLTATITPTIGGDTYAPISVTRDNVKNVLWEVYSDKYIDIDEFTYTISVEVDPPSFGDDPISYGAATPVTVPLPKGHVKHIVALSTPLPSIPADKKAQVVDWCAQASRATVQ